MSAALQVEDIHSYYGKSHIIQGVSLEVRDGEIVTLLGRNGAGKSSTLKSISGLLTPKRGKIWMSGRETTGWPAYRIAQNGLSLVPEDRGIFSLLTVEEIVDQIKKIRAAGVPILLVEQNLAVCTALADRHYILELGRIAYHGTGAQFIADEDARDRYLGVKAN